MAIYFLLTGMGVLLLALAALALVWLVRRGQFDDLDSPPMRMLHDDQALAGSSSHTKNVSPPSGKDSA